MDKLSDILKEKKVEIQGEIDSIDSVISSLESSLNDRNAEKAEKQALLAKIDTYIDKETEIDALFDEPSLKLK